MGTQLPSPKGAQPPPNFRPMSIVAKRLDGSTFTQRTHTCGELTSADVSSHVTVCGWLRHSGLFLLLRDAYGMVQAVVSNPEGPSSPVTWHGGRPRSGPHCARWGPSSPPPKKGAQPPNFQPMSIVAKWLDGSRCHLVRRYARAGQHCVRCGPGSTPKGHSPPFLAHDCCGQMAGWIKMPLGVTVGLGLGHNVLHGDPAPPKGA